MADLDPDIRLADMVRRLAGVCEYFGRPWANRNNWSMRDEALRLSHEADALRKELGYEDPPLRY